MPDDIGRNGHRAGNKIALLMDEWLAQKCAGHKRYFTSWPVRVYVLSLWRTYS